MNDRFQEMNSVVVDPCLAFIVQATLIADKKKTSHLKTAYITLKPKLCNSASVVQVI
jgi:hypothetical protein